MSFKLSNTNGGVALALESDRTDTEGNVKAVVLVVRLTTRLLFMQLCALLDNKAEISTSSQPIPITTGLPSQERMSIADETF